LKHIIAIASATQPAWGVSSKDKGVRPKPRARRRVPWALGRRFSEVKRSIGTAAADRALLIVRSIWSAATRRISNVSAGVSPPLSTAIAQPITRVSRTEAKPRLAAYRYIFLSTPVSPLDYSAERAAPHFGFTVVLFRWQRVAVCLYDQQRDM